MFLGERKHLIQDFILADSEDVKQLMAGGGVALIGTTLVPLLRGLFG